jgi:hypothetical protein
MKTTNILYWVFTGILCAFTLFGGVYDLMMQPDALKAMNDLKLPEYLAPLLGVAKILAVVAILWPGFHRLTEWAYAGIAIDVIGAAYCNYFAGIPISKWLVAILLNLVLLSLSYYYHHKRLVANRKKLAEVVA